MVKYRQRGKFYRGEKVKHKGKVTVIDKKLYPELQREYCADPNAGACPCYHVGDEFIFYRGDGKTISGIWG